jgi:hypothetical protein
VLHITNMGLKYIFVCFYYHKSLFQTYFSGLFVVLCSFFLAVGLEELVTTGNKTDVDGWHTIQFAGGKNSPKKFKIRLLRSINPSRKVSERPDLLKLRADVLKVTPRAEKILNKLPTWTSQFGKSTSPYNLAFLASLPVKF